MKSIAFISFGLTMDLRPFELNSILKCSLKSLFIICPYFAPKKTIQLYKFNCLENQKK